MVRRNSVGKYRRNSDDFAVNRNVVGNSSEYTDELPTTTTVTFFIGMSSKSRRKIPTNHILSEFRRKKPTEFRRLNFFGFDRKFVSIPSQMSDDLGVRRNLRRNSVCFLVVLDGTGLLGENRLHSKSGSEEMSWVVGYLEEIATNQLQVGGSPCVASHGSGRMRGGTSCSTCLAACLPHMQDATTPPRCQAA
ncbi:hypothetical protein F2Q70_00008978 [Brassica cretica]|uniref:Uncharacterized protein n=1 Tax=Brassica cretica TaxID=69181 RepID=A0A8S9M788_BRACR|nr:hypothetical protein F2Q70_00008978 [Brassica cretica]